MQIVQLVGGAVLSLSFLASLARSLDSSLPVRLSPHPAVWPCSDGNATVPNPVLGGVTTFLFASVVVSGLRVLSYMDYTRRDRFILAAAMSFGIGDLLMPNVFTYLFDGVGHPNAGLQGLFDSITIVLSTPCEWFACARFM